MRKIIVTTWITLDGYISGPNGVMDWIMVDETMGQYEYNLVNSADTLILGRVTYQSFAGSWPHVPDNPSVSEGEKEYARILNSMRKIVFSKSLEKAEWNNSQLMRGILPEDIAKLKQEPGKDIVVYGSASIVQAFTKLGLIDEYQLLVHPVALGSGKPLFAGLAEPAHLRLLQTKSFPSGVIGLYYTPRSK